MAALGERLLDLPWLYGHNRGAAGDPGSPREG